MIKNIIKQYDPSFLYNDYYSNKINESFSKSLNHYLTRDKKRDIISQSTHLFDRYFLIANGTFKALIHEPNKNNNKFVKQSINDLCNDLCKCHKDLLFINDECKPPVINSFNDILAYIENKHINTISIYNKFYSKNMNNFVENFNIFNVRKNNNKFLKIFEHAIFCENYFGYKSNAKFLEYNLEFIKQVMIK